MSEILIVDTHELDDAVGQYENFLKAVVCSASVILVSELGDKTFIITAIMAMKNSRSLVFISSSLALLLMTVLSVCMGMAVTVIPSLYTHYASIVLFLCFGLKMLKEAYDMLDESEFEEVEKSLEDPKSTEHDPSNEQATTAPAAPAAAAPANKSNAKYWTLIKVFTMILVAEWGDRSQISTIILAAREDVVGVFLGSFGGHVFCTALAVIGGRVVAEIISIRTLTFIGGLIFLFFATFSIIVGPD